MNELCPITHKYTHTHTHTHTQRVCGFNYCHLTLIILFDINYLFAHS